MTEDQEGHRPKRRRIITDDGPPLSTSPATIPNEAADRLGPTPQPLLDDHSPPESNSPADEDLFLSEVHINTWNGAARTYGQYLRLTHFRVTPPQGYNGGIPPFVQQNDHEQACIHIEHEMATPLRAVGLQVWMGALVLADYVLSMYEGGDVGEAATRKYQASERSISGGVGGGGSIGSDCKDTGVCFTPETTVLEVGCGAGLVAAVCGKICKTVYATDIFEKAGQDGDVGILKLCQRNMAANDVKDRVRVRRLNFRDEKYMDAELLTEIASDGSTERKGVPNGDFGDFSWRPSELAHFHQKCTLILAADIIYDDGVTFAFLHRLPSLLRPAPTSITPNPQTKQLILALEKRVVFSLHEQDVVAPARDYLFATLEALNADREDRGAPGLVKYEKIDVDAIPQWFEYRRNEHLEMWRFWMEG